MPRHIRAQRRRKADGDQGDEPEPEEPAPVDRSNFVRVFYLYFATLFISYHDLMKDITKHFEAVTAEENRTLPQGRKMPNKIYGKVYTPMSQTAIFLVQMVCPDLGTPVILLFTMHDLYFKGYYAKGVWWVLQDFDYAGKLPPQEQFPYDPANGIRVLTGFTTDYGPFGVGVAAMCKVGLVAFRNCFATLNKTATLFQGKKANLLRHGPLTLPAVAISEALRNFHQKDWIEQVLARGESIVVNRAIVPYFNYWEKLSESIYKQYILPSKPMDLVKFEKVMEAMCIIKQMPEFNYLVVLAEDGKRGEDSTSVTCASSSSHGK